MSFFFKRKNKVSEKKVSNGYASKHLKHDNGLRKEIMDNASLSRLVEYDGDINSLAKDIEFKDNEDMVFLNKVNHIAKKYKVDQSKILYDVYKLIGKV